MRVFSLLFFAFIALTICCAEAAHSTPLTADHASFAEYQQATQQWLKDHRHFQTTDHETEMELNAPQEWRPDGTPKAGILLTHGLGDSAFAFHDIGPRLAQHGFLVRALLLPGHGSQPTDMLNVSLEDWQALISRQTQLLKRETPQVFLGGFSTGANLALLEAFNDNAIAGVLLFSPAFRSNNGYDWLLPWIAPFKSWLRDPDDRRPQQTLVRYRNIPTQGFAQFYRSSATVQNKLLRKTFDKPTLIVMTEHDSVIDVQTIACLFKDRFTNSQSRLIWYGVPPTCSAPRMVIRPDTLPELRISQFSHMGILFSPRNPYYGSTGSLRVCENGQSEEAYRLCQKGGEVWYSAWGLNVPDKIHARLTFNPYFDWQMTIALDVLGIH